jgi:hypothetical protein
MTTSADIAISIWPWIALAGIGLFHGLNPAMGWLFAVAIGMHRNSQRAVILALAPIALGHALAIAFVVAVVLMLGMMVDRAVLMRTAGLVLIGWALWHAVRGHRQRVSIGMQAGALGLTVWSFLMASAHGAGLMVVPFLFPICSSGTAAFSDDGATASALAAVGLHTAAMMSAIAVISVTVYRFVGIGILRSAWVNLDAVWIGALLVCGGAILLGAA